MTYRELYDLKFRQGWSTCDLMRRFPGDAGRIRDVALFDLTESTLEAVGIGEEIRIRLQHLKKRLGPK